jgi:propionate CoA-transferase
VFRLTKEGLVLEEIAPGVDLDKNILQKMEFKPIISSKLVDMDRTLFLKEKMGIRKSLLEE